MDILIYIKPRIFSAFSPIIIDEPETVETVVGKDATLSCQVFGSPKPEVKWANKLLASGIEGVHYVVDPVIYVYFFNILYSMQNNSRIFL